MRNKATLLLIVFVISISCARGYRGKSDTASPEELRSRELSTQLSMKSEEMMKSAPKEMYYSVRDFAESAARFQNATFRFGSNSLEARDLFDRLRYHSTQLGKIIDSKQHAALYTQWEDLHTNYVTEIGRLLGYRGRE